MTDYRAQHILTEADLADAGLTLGHIKAWITAHPSEGMNLARTFAFVSDGDLPLVGGQPHMARVADWIQSTVDDLMDKSMCSVDLLEEMAFLDPIPGKIDVSEQDHMDWARLRAVAVGRPS